MDDGGHINVLTLNAWGIPYISKDVEARMVAISEELAKGQYQLVHLQELWSTRHYQMISEKVKDVLPYSFYFHSGFIGSGCATFSAYPIVDTFFHKYSHNGHFWDVFFADWYAGKGVGCAVIQHPKGKIYSFNTHLHADYDTKCDDCLEECRVLQSYELAQFVKHTTRPGDAIIVSGDLNSTPASLGTKALLEFAQLNDTYEIGILKPRELYTQDCEFNKYVSEDDPTCRLDYIFSSNAFECLTCNLAMQKIPNTDLHFSDHEGYTATLQFKESDVNRCTEYIDGPASRTILTQLYTAMKKGEQLSGEIHWKKLLSLCVAFLVLVVMPVLSVDTFHVIFPAISTWCGKGVFVLQMMFVVLFAVYLWVVTYVRLSDVKAFRSVCSDMKVKLRAYEEINGRKEG